MSFRLTDDAQVRAMVALLEAQAAQVTSLRKAVETLEGRLSLRNALDVVVADEVQQSLANLRMALQALRRIPTDDRRSKWLVDEASERVELLAGRIGELLSPAPLARVSFERETAKEVAFAEVLERALDGVPGLPDGLVRSEAPAELVVSTAPTRLAAVLGALVDNAARHGEASEIVVDANLAFGDLVIRVLDDGPGLGGVDPESLFPAFEGDGAGVGLYVARMLARSLGGDVTLADRPEGGAVATVSLPQQRDDDAARESMRELSAGW